MGLFPKLELVGPHAGPPLWMLHGVTRRWQTFLPLLPALSLRWEVWGVDQRGHGLADRARGYRVVDYVEDLVGALSRSSGPRVVLYGHSLGAMVALGAAARVPQRVRALVLEDPPFHTMGQRLHTTRLASYFRGLEELVRARPTLEQYLQRLPALEYVDPTDGTRVRLGEIRDAASIRFSAWCLTRLDPEVLAPVVSGNWLDGFEWLEEARQIQVPTLVMQADPRAGGMLTDEDRGAFENALVDASVTVWPGVGHNIHEARPSELSAKVLAFLESVRDE